MSKYTNITKAEMEEFLEIGADGKPLVPTGWYPLSIKGTYELVYGRLVRHDITLRIYSAINPSGFSRAKGSDAIRVCLFWKEHKLAEPKLIGVEKRVHRVAGWRKNLYDRILNWEELMGPVCPCGAPTVNRTGPRGDFFGCVRWPQCPKNPKKEMKSL
jgi:hypothetical protein